MRQSVLGRRLHGCGLLLAAMSAARCAGSSGAERPEDTTARLTGPEAAQCIRKSERFREPIRVEAWSTLGSPTTEALTAAGYLERSGASPILFRLTEKGRTSGIDTVEFQIGTPVFRSPLAVREVVAVSNVAEVPGTRSAVSVEFTYRTALTPVGQQLRDAGSALPELSGHDLPARGTALLVQSADGWRIERVDL